MSEITPEGSVVHVFTEVVDNGPVEPDNFNLENVTSLYEDTRASVLKMVDGIQVLRDFANGTTATNEQINANPAPYIKAVVREVIEVERTVIRIARLVSGMTDSTDTGA